MEQEYRTDKQKGFLELLAADLIHRYGIDSRNLRIILPGKRAGLFLGRAWAVEASKPVWAPDVLTMEDFVYESAGLKPVDELSLVLKLFRVCGALNPEEFSFGQFSGWGSVVLRDFNDVDLFMADPAQVFMNLLEAKELSLWTPGDAQQLTDFEEKYILFYKNLLPWYQRFRDELFAEQHAYQGMAFRYLAEHQEELLLQDKDMRYVFAGFNAFTPSEERIVKGLIDAGRAEIIWDADEWYLMNEMQEAGYFMRQWMKRHGSDDFRFIGEGLRNNKMQIHVYGVQGVRGQARLAGELLSVAGNPSVETAVVLPDESLLLPVMNAIPDGVESFNVTMGLSLRHTPALSWLLHNLHLFSRHAGRNSDHYRLIDLLPVIQHPWFAILINPSSDAVSPAEVFSGFNGRYCSVHTIIKLCSGLGVQSGSLAGAFFAPISHPVEFVIRMTEGVRTVLKIPEMKEKPFQQGALIETLRILQSVGKMISDEMDAEEGFGFLRYALGRLAASASVPFSGEPLEGVQLLGLLETRNLDFRHVILLATNEGVLPAGKKHNSLIPADIRRYHGLPGWQYHDAVYAYHFYHLLQRAERVDILYNSDLSSDFTGEMSRFIRQIESELISANPSISYAHHQVSDTLVKVDVQGPGAIEKNESVYNALVQSLSNRRLSPSQISHYIQCPLRFFYSFVAGIREAEAFEESFDHRELGTLVHEVLREIYRPLTNTSGKEMKDSGSVTSDEGFFRRAISGSDQKVIQEMQKVLGMDKDITGRNLIICGVAQYMVRSQLYSDLSLFASGKRSVMDLERNLNGRLLIQSAGSEVEVKLGGIMDRVDFDYETGRFVIADYKTGLVEKKDLVFDHVATLFEDPGKEKAFQLMFYSWLYSDNFQRYNLSAGLIPLKKPSSGFLPLQPLESLEDEAAKALLGEFEDELVAFCTTLLDRGIPFSPTTDTERCTLCPYSWICMPVM